MLVAVVALFVLGTHTLPGIEKGRVKIISYNAVCFLHMYLRGFIDCKDYNIKNDKKQRFFCLTMIVFFEIMKKGKQ